jgi:DNA invertase Pin-like site-specific DNA recombinase
MSEFELNLMRQRAREAFEQKVKRGFALWELPVGFVRNDEDRIEKTPDRQVQQAVTGSVSEVSAARKCAAGNDLVPGRTESRSAGETRNRRS